VRHHLHERAAANRGVEPKNLEPGFRHDRFALRPPMAAAQIGDRTPMMPSSRP